MTDSVAAQSRWTAYRRLKREWIAMWFGLAPLVVFSSAIGAAPLKTGAGTVLLGCYLARFAWLSASFTRWPCPRCGLPFIRRKWRLSGLNDILPYRRCKHCGLDEYSEEVLSTQAH